MYERQGTIRPAFPTFLCLRLSAFPVPEPKNLATPQQRSAKRGG